MISSAPAPSHSERSSSLNPASLGDDAGDLVPAGGEQRPDGVRVVVRQHDRVGGRRACHPRRVRQPECRDPRPGGDQQRVDVAVVAPGELHHQRPAGVAAGQAQRGHRRLGAGVDQPDLLDRGPRDDLRRKLDLAGRGGAERRPVRQRPRHRGDDRRVRVPEDHRPPGADQVNVLPAVHVEQVRAETPLDEPGCPAHRAERPDRGVNAARGYLKRAGEQFGGAVGHG
jgi:hypothetical protein